MNPRHPVRHSIRRPSHLAGTSKCCALPTCNREIPLNHVFCIRHFEMLAPDVRCWLVKLAQYAQSGSTQKVNALRDYTRECSDKIYAMQVGQ